MHLLQVTDHVIDERVRRLDARVDRVVREALNRPVRFAYAKITPCTPNDSLTGSRTSVRLRKKVPIGYSETPQIHPQNYPFPSTIITPI